MDPQHCKKLILYFILIVFKAIFILTPIIIEVGNNRVFFQRIVFLIAVQ